MKDKEGVSLCGGVPMPIYRLFLVVDDDDDDDDDDVDGDGDDDDDDDDDDADDVDGVAMRAFHNPHII